VPEVSSLNSAIDDALRLASLAPSAHNTQPWEYVREDQRIRVFRSRERTLDVGDPTTRQACLGVGMFVETFVIAARNSGLSVSVGTPYATPGETELATLDVSDLSRATESDPLTAQLFDGISRRHTNRGLYDPNEPAAWLDDWQVTSQDVRMFVVRDDGRRDLLARATGKSVRLALSLPAMRRELASLVHWSSESFTIGMPVEALVENADTHQEAGVAFVRAALPAQEEISLAERYRTTPAIIVLSTTRDDPQAWVNVGREGARLMLRAAADGLAHCISAGPIEIPTLSPIVRDATDAGVRPQLLFRVGRPLQERFSVRAPRVDWHSLGVVAQQ
jgi:hypothetical protein